jgi:Ca-activated chloride channel family protein
VNFSHPWWLPAGAAGCLVLIGLWYRYDARQKTDLEKFVAAHLRPQLTRSISVAGRRARRASFLAAVACLFLALSGPLVGYRWEEITRRGYDIVFAIDTSRSMSTPDVRPDRLTRAKLAIDDFAAQLDGDAVGIVAFAGRASLVSPITLDYGAFHETLNAIDTNTIARGGTNISAAIREAQVALERRPGSDKVLILVTDGEDLEGDSLDAARTAARQNGLKIYTVGVGTLAGELIPLPPGEGGGFVKDEAGALVRSRLDEAALKAIAAATGGVYAPLGAQGEGLETIFKAVFGSVGKHDLAVRRRKIYIERYQWPLAAAVGLLFASLLIGTRRRRGAAGTAGNAGASVTAKARTAVSVVPGLLLFAMVPIRGTHAAVTSPINDEQKGTAAYRSGRFPQAAQAFEQSIGRAPSSDAQRLAVQEDAYYNLGNALYRSGQMTEKSDRGTTIEKWTEAVKAYETALQLRPDDADSKYNRDLVKRKIDALRQPPPPPQNQGSGKGQAPPPPQSQGPGKNKAPPPPPGSASNPPPPPQGAPPPKGTPPPGSGAQGSPPPPSAGTPPPAAPPGGSQRQGQPPPGQMSREDARELLDSEKSDEKHPLSVPDARPGADEPPEKPYKNW